MNDRKDNASILAVGVAACAVCCAGPVLGVLAAIGLGTAAGFALFGTIAIVLGAGIVAFVVIRRRRRALSCSSIDSVPASVEFTNMRSRR